MPIVNHSRQEWSREEILEISWVGGEAGSPHIKSSSGASAHRKDLISGSYLYGEEGPENDQYDDSEFCKQAEEKFEEHRRAIYREAHKSSEENKTFHVLFAGAEGGEKDECLWSVELCEEKYSVMPNSKSLLCFP